MFTSGTEITGECQLCALAVVGLAVIYEAVLWCRGGRADAGDTAAEGDEVGAADVGEFGTFGIVMLADGIKATVVVIDVGQRAVVIFTRISIATDSTLHGGAFSADSGADDKAVLNGNEIERADKGTDLVVSATGRGTDGGADDEAVIYGTLICFANKCSDACTTFTAGDDRADEADVLHGTASIN